MHGSLLLTNRGTRGASGDGEVAGVHVVSRTIAGAFSARPLKNSTYYSVAVGRVAHIDRRSINRHTW